MEKLLFVVATMLIMSITVSGRTDWWYLTWEAEGNDISSSPYFSRKLHVPSSNSGLTIGRGYDMKMRTRLGVKRDLTNCGVGKYYANLISKGAGLSGQRAKRFIQKNKLKIYVMTTDQQKKLFNLEKGRKISVAKRIFTKRDVVKAYGKADWSTRHWKIKGIVLDLLYRGDYTGFTRRFLQPVIVANNVKKLKKIMHNRQRWRRVPRDRFNRRKNYMG